MKKAKPGSLAFRLENQQLGTNKKHALLFSVLFYIVLYFLSCFAIMVNSVPEKLEFEVGAPSSETVVAPKDLTDQNATQRLIQEAVQKVEPVYHMDHAVIQDCEKQIQTTFASAEQIRAAAKRIFFEKSTSEQAASFDSEKVDWNAMLSEEEMEQLSAIANNVFSKQEILMLAAMPQEQLTELRDQTLLKTGELLSAGIIQDHLKSAIADVKTSLSENKAFSTLQVDLATNIVSLHLSANMIYDSEATELEKQLVTNSIKPVTYKKGQNIVQKGEIITQTQYDLLKELGFTGDDSSMLSRWITTFLLIAGLYAVWMIYVFRVDQAMLLPVKNVCSIFLLTMLGLLAAMVCKKIQNQILPVFLPAILAGSYMHKRSTLVYSCFLSILIAFVMAPTSGFLFDSSTVKLLLSGILGCAVATMVMMKKQHRGEYILAGLVAGLITALVYIAYGIMEGYDARRYILTSIYGLAGGLMCGLLAIGFLPIWEALFSLATPQKLLELSNPGSSLLKRLMIEAPGTYHHSIMVANLAEAGAAAIGADELLSRVAAYYHDIGKIKNPFMFKENQLHMENPHDFLPPRESAAIIAEHVSYGKKLAEKYKLPQKLVTILSEHHGNSLISFFYYEAKKQEKDADIKDFRYPGPKPSSKEAGLVMLADIVEAAIRAKETKPNQKELSEQIDKLFRGKYDDGQLANCPITIRDLSRIKEAFIGVLEGANHERIVYPDEEEEMAK